MYNQEHNVERECEGKLITRVLRPKREVYVLSPVVICIVVAEHSRLREGQPTEQLPSRGLTTAHNSQRGSTTQVLGTSPGILRKQCHIRTVALYNKTSRPGKRSDHTEGHLLDWKSK